MIKTSYYSEKLDLLYKDKYQIEAYESMKNTVVLAGPGSGKTTVLTLKLMQLLNGYIQEPRGLACLTYSREAAREFKDRLIKLGFTKRKNVFLGTVHSFCLSEILGKFADLYNVNIPKPIKVVPEEKKHTLFNQACWNLNIKNMNVGRMDCARLLRIDGKSEVSIAHDVDAEKVANKYETLLFAEGFIDFETIIIESTKLIQTQKYVRDCLYATYPWLLIDEYQDLGKPLHEMVLSLIENTKIRFFAVGDPDQSIYGFQGAKPDYLSELANRDEVKKIILINNYRSNQDIIDGSELVLKQTRGYKAVERKNEKAIYAFVKVQEEMKDQYNYFAKIIIPKCIENGIPFEEIAVLVGNNNECKELADVCKAENVPYYIVRHSFNRTDFIKWLENCTVWLTDADQISFNELYDYWKSTKLSVNKNILFSEKEDIEERKKLLTVLEQSRVESNSLVDWFQFIRSKLEFDKLLGESELMPDEINNLNAFEAEISGDEYLEYDIKKFSNIGKPKNQIIISTRHSSKGLEFEVIIMMGMEDDRFPSYYAKRDSKLLEETNRLCFVCVSRAKRICILMRSQYYTIPTRNGPWRKEYQPSEFWRTLYNKYGC